MKYTLLVTLFLVTFLSLHSVVVEETGSLRNFLFARESACEYDNWVSHISEGIAISGYNLYAPWDRQTNGFGTFHIASAGELTVWRGMIQQFLAGNFDAAQDTLDQYALPFKVVKFIDNPSGHIYYMIRENLNMTYNDDQGTTDAGDDEHGSFDYGWGIYIYNPDASEPVIITVVHPNDDFIAPVIAFQAFQLWDAMFLQIGGAGREVSWTTASPPYTNAKSLSDASRVEVHALTQAYEMFCDKIRSQFGQREFSAQIHSYDWNRHPGFANVQISAGYGKDCINLPTRDLSDLHQDLINDSSPIMIPANTIGVHRQVGLNDYYAIYNNEYPMVYTNADTTITVNNYVDLTGFSDNRQAVYTLNGWSDLDTRDPFFHIEMDELPNCYDQTQNNLKWFYGYDPVNQVYNMNQIYDNAWAYYSKWVQSMAVTLPYMTQFNDDANPTPPTNLHVYSQSYDNITLAWDKTSSYDFKSYEIMYATSPITGTHYNLFTRDHNPVLACQAQQQVQVTGLSPNQNYYFKIRARDYHDNLSGESNQVSVFTGPAKINNLTAVGKDGRVSVRWNVSVQNGNQGFIIYRMTGNGEFDPISSWETNAALAGSTSPNLIYTYEDLAVVNGLTYTYKIAAENSQNEEYIDNFSASASPQPLYKFYLTNQTQTLRDSVAFATNPYASDGNDGSYDIQKGAAPSTNYVYSAFFEQYWSTNGTYLSQETHGFYDVNQDYKSWALRLKTDQLNQALTFKVSPNFPRHSQKLYIYDQQTGAYTNMLTDSLAFSAADTNLKAFIVYMGNLQPQITFGSMENRICQEGNPVTITWGGSFNFLVSHYDLYLKNDTDSLLISANIPGGQSSYVWYVPAGVTMPNTHAWLKVTSTDGEVSYVQSGFIVGVLPGQNTFALPAGSYMVSNLWSSSNLVATDVFGTDSDLFTYQEPDTYTEAQVFSSGIGYWVNATNPFSYVSSLALQKTTTTVTLTHGWNLIPNPQYCTYTIDNLRFSLNNASYACGEAIEMGLISRMFYVYRDGGYVMTNTIYPFESFFMYVYADDRLNMSVLLTPYYQGLPVTPTELGWQLRIKASQDNGDKDELIVGASSLSSTGFDVIYDIPEPPLKGKPGSLSLYAPKPLVNYPDFPYDKLNAEFREVMPDSVETDYFWDFKINVTALGPLTITCDETSFPSHYSAQMIVGEETYPLGDNHTFTLNYTHVGTYAGRIQIRNNGTGNHEGSTATVSSLLSIYPNPFNPTTNIAFQLKQPENVTLEVYNLKGQKVDTLAKGRFESGNHSVVWNGKNMRHQSVASGIYFVRLQTESGKHQIRKVMLLK